MCRRGNVSRGENALLWLELVPIALEYVARLRECGFRLLDADNSALDKTAGRAEKRRKRQRAPERTTTESTEKCIALK